MIVDERLLGRRPTRASKDVKKRSSRVVVCVDDVGHDEGNPPWWRGRYDFS